MDLPSFYDKLDHILRHLDSTTAMTPLGIRIQMITTALKEVMFTNEQDMNQVLMNLTKMSSIVMLLKLMTKTTKMMRFM